MRQYIMRRLCISLIVLFGVSLIMYALVRSMPADYVSLSTSAAQKITQGQKDQLRKIYGLDKSIPMGYLDWVGSALKGNFGVSLVYNRPVSEVIKGALPVTLFI